MSQFQTFPTKIEGVRLVRGTRHEDDRGYFEELFSAGLVEQLGLPGFVQTNASFSFQGVLRGLHIQREKPQGKLVRCLHGTIWDVWVDLRTESRTFKKWECLTLHARGGQEDMPDAVYLPPGLAHGFLAVSQHALVHYACTTPYDKELDGGIYWGDKTLGIDWPFPEEFTPTVSPKDANLPSLDEYLKQMR